MSSKQAQFLMLMCIEAMYGGAAGGGKSDALLMGALQFVDVPGYNALLLRRRYKDLALPEALMDRARVWLQPTDAHWSASQVAWVFPSTARVVFGYLEHDIDKYQYQSAAFQYIGFDELTQFTESQYRYLFSRTRRLEDSYVPLRVRGASNPGNVGHDWVKRRFIDEGLQYNRIFIPAKLQDNPNLDQESYIKSLDQLDPITRKQYLEGDWSARHGGSKFQREWFEIVPEAPADAQRVRYWDMAATTPKGSEDPDWTAGAKLAMKDGIYYLEDMVRFRGTPKDCESRVKLTAELDYIQHGHRIATYMETEGGSSGISMVDHYQRNILRGFTFRGDRPTGDKEVRANPVSSCAQGRNLKLVRGKWIGAFLDEAEAFPLGSHDDQIDAISGAFAHLRRMGPVQVKTGVRAW